MSHGAPKKRNEEDEDSSEGPPPPDGGWGWAVTFGSFMIHIVTDGITYSFGVFFTQFLSYFNSSNAATSWIASILVGVTLCSGPISSAFVNKYGCRAVTIAGSILASLSMLVSVFAPNVSVLCLTVGLGTGLGCGLIYLPAIVSVTTYFEKYRSLATGIAVCGSGLGTFIFAPLNQMLIHEYGWRGAFLILSAIILNCIIFGALFRPLEYEDDVSSSSSQAGRNKTKYDKIEGSGYNLKPTSGKLDIHCSERDLQEQDGTTGTTVTNGDISIQRPHSIGHFSLPIGLKPITAPSERNGNISHNNKNNTARLALSQPMLLTSTASEGGRQHFGSQSLRRNGPLHRRDVFYQGSLMNIPQYRSKSDLKATEETDLMERAHSSSTTRNRKKSSCGNCVSEDTKETLREMLDFSLLRDPIFILFTVSNFCTSIGFNVPYIYIVPMAKTLNIDTTEASYLLSVIGIANTVGRIILGYISDKTWVNRLWVYNVCLTICGLATTFSAFCWDFYSLAVYAAVFGFNIGAYVGLTSVILVDLLGLDKLTNAFGLLLLFQGIASLIGPPIAGWLYDATSNYDLSFYIAGLTITISGVILFAIPYLQRVQARRERSAVAERI